MKYKQRVQINHLETVKIEQFPLFQVYCLDKFYYVTMTFLKLI